MDSPFFAIIIWIIIGSIYGLFFWSLYLAVTLKVETSTKLLYCIGIIIIQPFASLIFIGWYYNKYKTLQPIKTTTAIPNVGSSATLNTKNYLSKIQIICPECGFTRSMRVALIPPNTRTAMCPKCKAKFGIGDLSRADGKTVHSVRGPGGPGPDMNKA